MGCWRASTNRGPVLADEESSIDLTSWACRWLLSPSAAPSRGPNGGVADSLNEANAAFRAGAGGMCSPLSGEADQRCSWRVIPLMTHSRRPSAVAASVVATRLSFEGEACPEVRFGSSTELLATSIFGPLPPRADYTWPLPRRQERLDPGELRPRLPGVAEPLTRSPRRRAA